MSYEKFLRSAKMVYTVPSFGNWADDRHFETLEEAIDVFEAERQKRPDAIEVQRDGLPALIVPGRDGYWCSVKHRLEQPHEILNKMVAEKKAIKFSTDSYASLGKTPSAIETERGGEQKLKELIETYGDPDDVSYGSGPGGSSSAYFVWFLNK